MVNLLGRGRFSGACSPESEGPQQPIEVDQGDDVDCRWTKGHRCAYRGIEHPGGQDDRDAWIGFNDRDLSPGPPFDVELPDLAAVQRMPTVMDRHILIDMGRMNPRWRCQERTACSRAATKEPKPGPALRR
jgi:hypothetical protein